MSNELWSKFVKESLASFDNYYYNLYDDLEMFSPNLMSLKEFMFDAYLQGSLNSLPETTRDFLLKSKEKGDF